MFLKKTPAVSFTSQQERQKALIQVLKDQRWDLERRLHRIKERQSDEISDLTGEHVFTGSMSGDMYPPVKRHAGKGRYGFDCHNRKKDSNGLTNALRIIMRLIQVKIADKKLSSIFRVGDLKDIFWFHCYGPSTCFVESSLRTLAKKGLVTEIPNQRFKSYSLTPKGAILAVGPVSMKNRVTNKWVSEF